MLSCPAMQPTAIFSSSSSAITPPKQHPPHFLPSQLTPTTPPSLTLSLPIHSPKLISSLHFPFSTYSKHQSTHQRSRPGFFGSVPLLGVSVRVGGTREGTSFGPIEKKKGKSEEVRRMKNLNHKGVALTSVKKPLKRHMVEKHFHQDNMSATEKLRIELAKVGDEFKISESDCGSAGFQVAQLTARIKHLSSVLHKKDYDSLRGLQAMVQRRKKLLKYLRRSDFESFSLVISKLGLRDHSDHTKRSRN